MDKRNVVSGLASLVLLSITSLARSLSVTPPMEASAATENYFSIGDPVYFRLMKTDCWLKDNASFKAVFRNEDESSQWGVNLERTNIEYSDAYLYTCNVPAGSYNGIYFQRWSPDFSTCWNDCNHVNLNENKNNVFNKPRSVINSWNGWIPNTTYGLRYKVHFLDDKGNKLFDSVEVAGASNKDCVIASLPTPSIPGKKFIRWTSNGTNWNGGAKFTLPNGWTTTTLIAEFEEEDVNARFLLSDNEEIIVGSGTYHSGDLIRSIAPTSYTKDDKTYMIGGWKDEAGNKIDLASARIESKQTYTAIWTEQTSLLKQLNFGYYYGENLLDTGYVYCSDSKHWGKGLKIHAWDNLGHANSDGSGVDMEYVYTNSFGEKIYRAYLGADSTYTGIQFIDGNSSFNRTVDIDISDKANVSAFYIGDKESGKFSIGTWNYQSKDLDEVSIRFAANDIHSISSSFAWSSIGIGLTTGDNPLSYQMFDAKECGDKDSIYVDLDTSSSARIVTSIKSQLVLVDEEGDIYPCSEIKERSASSIAQYYLDNNSSDPSVNAYRDVVEWIASGYGTEVK